MAITQNWIVVGVFQEYAQARQAIENLRRAGFNDDEIGFLTRAGVIESPGDMGANMTTDAVSGGVIGGVVGAAVSLLIPAGCHATTRSCASKLVHSHATFSGRER